MHLSTAASITPAPHEPRVRWAMLALLALGESLGMTLWFSATAAAPALVAQFHLSTGGAAWLTMAVQGGFVAGTLVTAVVNLADLVAPRRLFALGCVLGAVATAAVTQAGSAPIAFLLRFATGAALAWVYPTGMKIVASWFHRERGTGLGVLVASLTLGQAFPHLLAAVAPDSSWQLRMIVSSALAVAGGLIVLVGVHDGPHLEPLGRFDARAAASLFTNRRTRLAAFGYFGHMWELYAMWSWAGVFGAASLAASGSLRASHTATAMPVASIAAFLAIATGAAGCLLGGVMADRIGRAKVAGLALVMSGSCAVASGLVFGHHPALLYTLLACWGLVVIADSAQFSALIADYSPRSHVGTALAVETCCGYLLTMVSIRLMPTVAAWVTWRWAFLALVPGPVMGVVAMRRLSADSRRVD
ncbi:MAG: MFS transporter [Bacteroidales bacterium]